MSTFRKITPPEEGEYPQSHQLYYDRVLTSENILQRLYDHYFEIERLISPLPENRLLYRYAEGKWSIKEVLVHIMDTERIFVYRALRTARTDQTPLPGFDDTIYAPASEADVRSVANLLEEYKTQRLSTLQFFQNLPEAAFTRMGKGFAPDGRVINTYSVRAFAFFLAGHELHHRAIIEERYLK